MRDSTAAYLGIYSRVSRIVRSQFEANGHPVEHAQGAGGLIIDNGIGANNNLHGDVLPRFEFVESAWIENSGRSGAAITHKAGVAELSFERCLFRGNVAGVSGGAIYVSGSAGLLLVFDRSIFEGNAVQTQQSKDRNVDVSVIVSTGGIGGDIEYLGSGARYPIWRIDVSVLLLDSVCFADRAQSSDLFLCRMAPPSGSHTNCVGWHSNAHSKIMGIRIRGLPIFRAQTPHTCRTRNINTESRWRKVSTRFGMACWPTHLLLPQRGIRGGSKLTKSSAPSFRPRKMTANSDTTIVTTPLFASPATQRILVVLQAKLFGPARNSM